MMLAATSISNRHRSAASERRRRGSLPLRRPHTSISLLEVDDDRVRGEKGDHDRAEVYEVAQIDDAAGDRSEMTQDAGPGDRVDEPRRYPVADQPEHDRRPGGDQHED